MLQTEVDDQDLIKCKVDDGGEISDSDNNNNNNNNDKNKNDNKLDVNKKRKIKDLNNDNNNDKSEDKIIFGKGWNSLNLSLIATTTIEPQQQQQQQQLQPQQSITNNALPIVMGGLFNKKKQDYFNKYKSLLLSEMTADKTQIERRIMKCGIKYLTENGLAYSNLTAHLDGKIYDEIIVRFESKEISLGNSSDELKFSTSSATENTKLKIGDPVIISRKNPLYDDLVFEGLLLEIKDSTIKVSIRLNQNNQNNNNQNKKDKKDNNNTTENQIKETIFKNSKPWRIDYGMNRVTTQRMMEALQMISSSQVLYKTKLYDIILNHLKGKSIESAASSEINVFKLERFEKIESNYPEDFNNWKLNESQRKAICSSIKRRISLIQGPPGTGKSSTAIHLVRLLCHLKSKSATNSSDKILVTSYTNTGVDNLLDGLLRFGIKVLRLGHPSTVRPDLLDATLDHHMEKAMKDYEQNANYNPMNVANVQHETKSRLLASADVICTTCISSGHPMIANEKYPIVIVDEASQATEPSILVPLLKSSEQLFLFGDQNQLAPTIFTKEAEEGGLSIGLFQRLFNEGVKPFLLEEQYRMHSKLLEFPNKFIYENRLLNGITDKDRPIPNGFRWPKENCPIAFINIENTKEEINSYSYFNNLEAKEVVRIFKDLLHENKELSIDDIGIITPYASQSRLIRNLLNMASFKTLPTVSTVDAVQGREKEVILLSTVRSNNDGRVGFLNDWRRLNVSITRARRGLIIIGNSSTLEYAGDMWKNYISWCKSNGLLININKNTNNNNTTTTTTNNNNNIKNDMTTAQFQETNKEFKKKTKKNKIK